MELPTDNLRNMTRRHLLQDVGSGVGAMALWSLLSRDRSAHAKDIASTEARGFHFPPRAKSVIYIHMVGAPSHLDLFDHKPALQKRNGQLCPDEFFQGKQLAFIRKQPTLLGSPDQQQFQFKASG